MTKIALVTRIVLAFVPGVVAIPTMLWARDLLLLNFCLSIIYFLGPIVYTRYLSHVDWTFEGDGLRKIQATIMASFLFFAGFFLVGLVLILPMWTGSFHASIFHLPLPYIEDSSTRIMVTIFITIHSLFMIIFDEVYFRLFVGRGTLYFEACAVLGSAFLSWIVFAGFVSLDERSRQFVIFLVFVAFGIGLMFIRNLINVWSCIFLRLGLTFGLGVALGLMRFGILKPHGLSLVLLNHPLNIWNRHSFF